MPAFGNSGAGVCECNPSIKELQPDAWGIDTRQYGAEHLVNPPAEQLHVVNLGSDKGCADISSNFPNHHKSVPW